MDDDLPIFVKWLEFLKWFLPTLEKFPKKYRFTMTDRMINMALDVVELLAEARYSREKRAILGRANLKLEKMRVLMRLSHQERLCSGRAYQFACKKINETGTMLGGWIKAQEKRR